MQSIWKSHKFFIFEKYYSIIAELDNLNKIVQIYKKKNILNNNFDTLITSLKDKISEEFNRIERLDYDDFFYILIELDYIKVTMQEVINHEHLIHSKIIQEIMESSPNIRPLPPIQKRYSSKVLSNLLDEHHEKLYKALSDSEDNATIYSIWSHNDGYAINNFSEQKYFSKHSFYYHDIAWNIPTIIDHEIILKAIQNNDTYRHQLKTIAENIKIACINAIDNDANNKLMMSREFKWKTYFQEFKDFINMNLENTLLELSADIIGAELHGKEYIMAFLHETLGEHMGRDFYVNNIRQEHLSFGLNTERDSLLLRQSIITTACCGIEETTYLSKIANGFYRLFIQDNNSNELAINQKMEKASRDEYDSNGEETKIQIKNHTDEALYYRRTFSQMYYYIVEMFMKDNSIMEYMERLVKNIEGKDTSAFFDNDNNSISKVLWEKRTNSLVSNKLPHRSILRQTLLKNLSINKTYEPYIMYYRHNIKTNFSHNQKVVFGTYSDIHVNPIIGDEIDIKGKITTCIKSFSDENESNYFETKHTLLRINHWENMRPSTNKTKLYILIYLKDSKNPKNIINLIENLSTSLEKEKNSFSISYVSSFKSFGPEDIVLEIEITNNTHTWEIIEFIRNKYSVKIQETFSSIVIEDITNMPKLNDNIWLKGYYRVNTNINYEGFLEKLNSFQKIKTFIHEQKVQIFDVTDKFYDFEIWWNKVPLSEIDTFHNDPKIKDIILDMEYYMIQGKA